MSGAALIQQLEAAEVGSRELDEAIHDVLCDGKFRTCIAGLSDEDGGLWMYEFDGHNTSSALRCTTSLDAALALAERVLPGARVMVERFHDGKGWAMVQGTTDSAKVMTDGNTPALALCAAILRARSAGEGK